MSFDVLEAKWLLFGYVRLTMRAREDATIRRIDLGWDWLGAPKAKPVATTVRQGQLLAVTLRREVYAQQSTIDTAVLQNRRVKVLKGK